MATTPIDGGLRPDTHERAREGVDHLRAAAHELIAAARAMLDVAEELVDDPESASALLGTLADVGAVARRVTGTGGWPAPRRSDGSGGRSDDPEDGTGAAGEQPRVERIRVS